MDEWLDNSDNIIEPLTTGHITQENLEKLLIFQELLEKIVTKDDINLYRGLGGDIADELLAAAEDGFAFDRCAPQSFTTKKDVALGFIDDEKGCCLLNIKVPEGTPIFYVDAKNIVDTGSDKHSIQEFILPPGRIVITDQKIMKAEVTAFKGVFMASKWPPLLVQKK